MPADLGFVDPACPLEWAHPLNQELITDLTVVPNAGWRGGKTLRDLVRGGHYPHDATLSGSPTWMGGNRAGGYGSLKYLAASSQFAQTPTINLAAVTQITVSWWMYWDAFANDDKLAWETSANSNSNAGAILVDPNESGSTQFFVNINTNGVNKSGCHFTRPSAAVWHHYVFCMDRGAGANQITAVYIDGLAQTLTYTITDNSSGFFGNYVWNLMSRNGTGLFGSGRMDGFRIWANRLLTDAEAKQDYKESRRGNPDRFRWVTGRKYWSTQVGGGGSSVTGSTTEASSGSESLTRLFAGFRTATEVPTSSESLTRFASEPRTTTDAPTSADVATLLQVLARTATAAPTSSESVVRGVVLFRTATEASSSSESLVRSVGLTRSVTDAPTSADVVTRLVSEVRITTDAPTSSDSTTRLFAGTRTATATPTSADVATRLLTVTRTTTDAPTSADVATRTGTFSKTTTDAPTSADVATRSQVLTRTVTAAPTSSDTAADIKGPNRSATEAPTSADVVTRSQVLTRALTAAPTSADVATRTETSLRSGTSAPTSSDVATNLVSHPRTTTEAPTSSESLTRTASETRTVTEAPTSSESLTKVVVFTRTTTDATTSNHAVTNAGSYHRANIDGLLTAEVVTYVRAGTGIAYDRITTESLSLSESVSFIRVPVVFPSGVSSIATKAPNRYLNFNAPPDRGIR